MKELYQKIAKVKSKIGKISKDMENPFYKSRYFDINKLLEQVEPLLSEQGLMLLQPLSMSAVESKIIDIETGVYVSSSMDMPQFNDPQKAGSCVTYYRRYTLQSLLALQAEDDDGNMASQGSAPSASSQSPKVTTWLLQEQFDKAMDSGTAEQIQNCLNLYNGKTGKGMKKEYRQKLSERLTQLQNQAQ